MNFKSFLCRYKRIVIKIKETKTTVDVYIILVYRMISLQKMLSTFLNFYEHSKLYGRH